MRPWQGVYRMSRRVRSAPHIILTVQCYFQCVVHLKTPCMAVVCGLPWPLLHLRVCSILATVRPFRWRAVYQTRKVVAHRCPSVSATTMTDCDPSGKQRGMSHPSKVISGTCSNTAKYLLIRIPSRAVISALTTVGCGLSSGHLERGCLRGGTAV